MRDRISSGFFRGVGESGEDVATGAMAPLGGEGLGLGRAGVLLLGTAKEDAEEEAEAEERGPGSGNAEAHGRTRTCSSYIPFPLVRTAAQVVFDAQGFSSRSTRLSP